MSKETAPGAGRTMADRRWFGNTRVVGQVELETFREEIKVAREDPYQLVLRQRTLPLTLLQEKKEDKRARIVEVEPFGDTFGHKATRKRPRLPAHELEGLASRAAAQGEAFVEKIIADSLHGPGEKDPLLSKGQSKRIWGELYKVLDSSDVVVQVLDARDPMGTRSWSVEKHLRDKCPTKQLVNTPEKTTHTRRVFLTFFSIFNRRYHLLSTFIFTRLFMFTLCVYLYSFIHLYWSIFIFVLLLHIRRPQSSSLFLPRLFIFIGPCLCRYPYLYLFSCSHSSAYIFICTLTSFIHL